ncbi:hypothetical protein GCM10020000_72380 [Streptomyces olivoverticillatus]
MRGVDDRASGGDLAQGAQQLVEFADAFLEQVGQAVGAPPEEVEGVVLVGVLGQDDDADAGVVAADGVGRGDAFGVVARRHPDVGDDGLGPQPFDGVEEFGGVAHGRDDRDVPGVLQQPTGALAHQVVVLGDDHAHRFTVH